MSKLAFFGNTERGMDVISILESLGGRYSDDDSKTFHRYLGSNPHFAYYINDEDEIQIKSLNNDLDLDEFENLGYKVYTIDKFEEIFGKLAHAGEYIQTKLGDTLRVIAPMWSVNTGLIYHCEYINDPNETITMRYHEIENVLDTIPNTETNETKKNDESQFEKFLNSEQKNDEMYFSDKENFFDKESVAIHQSRFWDRIRYGFEYNDDDKITCIDITKSDEYSSEGIALKYNPKKYEMTSDDNGNIILKAKISLPQTFDDCCDILNTKPSSLLSSGYATEELKDLEKLLICRDAFYKAIYFDIEQDSILKWKNAYVPIISKNDDGEICRKSGYAYLHILPFPTTESRDYFFEKFYDYINKCKKFIQ